MAPRFQRAVDDVNSRGHGPRFRPDCSHVAGRLADSPQQDVIAYLVEENRTLRSQLVGRRLRLTDAQRRRLAQRGKPLGRRMLTQVATIATPDTVFVIDLASRRVHIVGCTSHPDDPFMRQVTRTMTAADDGVLAGCRVLICDRDQKWSAPILELLQEHRVRIVRTPFQAPNCKDYASYCTSLV